MGEANLHFFNGHPYYYVLCLYAAVWRNRYQISVWKIRKTGIRKRPR